MLIAKYAGMWGGRLQLRMKGLCEILSRSIHVRCQHDTGNILVHRRVRVLKSRDLKSPAIYISITIDVA